ncbi:MAG: hypothetical protein K8R36_04055 [Planctomycetales bacterium]|nr:hypothetical protein [Planctomycetales bacterium]
MSIETLVNDEQRSEQEWLVAEQRRARRHTYNCRQLVAPFDGIRLPRQDEFDWAMFNDVSETGISFLAASEPATSQLVVAVGPAPFSFLIVDIVRVVPRDDLEGQPLQVGCTIVRELTE